jgi:hypothetical protein
MLHQHLQELFIINPSWAFLPLSFGSRWVSNQNVFYDLGVLLQNKRIKNMSKLVLIKLKIQ